MMTPDHLPTRRIRPRTPIVMAALCAAAVIFVQFWTPIEGNFRGPLTLLAILFLLIGVGFWFAFFSGVRWKKRLMVIALAIFVLVDSILAATHLLRREGSYTGAGVPRFVWSWTPRDVGPPLEKLDIATMPVDLSRTSTDDFPQFLGPDRSNIVAGVSLSRDWATHPPTLLWRRRVGAGWSGFAVVNGFAVTMEQRQDQEVTVCYNFANGQPVWVHGNKTFLRESEGGDGPRATPTVSDGHVYTFGGKGNLDCLDGATGKTIWSRQVLDNPDADRLHYGQTCSPLIIDDKVIVAGGQPGPALLAFDKLTGKPVWRSPRQLPGESLSGDADRASYASPSLVNLAGIRQILFVHQYAIAGHDPGDGRILWFYRWPGFLPKNSQAVAIAADQVYCSTGYAIGSVLLRITDAGGALSASEIWRTAAMKTEFSNVVIRGDFAYGLDDGALVCQNLATGKRAWRGERYGHGQILQAGDVLLVQSEDGKITLVDARPQGPTILGSIDALDSDHCWNTMALSGHTLVIRNNHDAACYRLP